MNPLTQFLTDVQTIGSSREQVENLLRAGLILQPRQLLASAAARLCDHPDGPTAVGYGGARGGGKSHWLLAQMGADDCQRVPGLKCLLLRKVGKANMEHFEDLRHRLFGALKHDFSSHRGILTFANGSRIIAGHFQSEKDIDAYLGLEYDIIGIEEATTLTYRKYQDISTCCRSSKPLPLSTLNSLAPSDGERAGVRGSTLNPQPSPLPPSRQLSTLNSQPSTPYWRPRIYSTTNPGGIGHAWYRTRFVLPYLEKREVETRFIPARVNDNAFNNPEYRRVLENLSGWQKRAWLEGDWDIAAGQFFTTFRRDVHVISDFDETRAREWFAALDYGFTHYTVVLLGCTDADGNTFIVDEHAERLWLPQRHAAAIKAMLARHALPARDSLPRPVGRGEGRGEGAPNSNCIPHSLSSHTQLHSALNTPNSALGQLRTPHSNDSQLSTLNSQLPLPIRWGEGQGEGPPCSSSSSCSIPLSRFVAGADVFSRQSDGTTIAAQYAREGLRLQPANMDRINGWAEVLQKLGDPAAGIVPRLFIHQRCARLVETLPNLQHDPNRPEDVLKVDADEDGVGGDDAADALRYLVATKARTIVQRKLKGL